ncbi:hypothetical protein [Alsobacter sp. R-9]
MTGEHRRREEERAEEARRTLERLSAETETVGHSALARAARHFGANDAPEGDRIELWGRRIGRSLGLVFALYLIWTIVQYFYR